MFEFYKYFLLFIIYSFLGWVFEVIVVAISTKKFSNRGFLIGPICPIYGVATTLMTILLYKYKNDYIVLFCMSFLICTFIEYFTSFIMEKLFKTRWWDYSHKKFNLNGRVCLQNSILFGIFGMVVIVCINNFFLHYINLLPFKILSCFSILLLIIIVIDFFISFNIMNKIKVITNNIRKDNTPEINERIRGFIRDKSILYKRILRAFPNFKINIKFKIPLKKK